jgi:hypothetical protein
MKKKFHRVLMVVFLAMMTVFSCERDDFNNTCNVDDPVEDLPWLRERISTILVTNPEIAKYQYISMAEYNGETVFMFGNCDPLALSVFPIFNCSDVLIGTLGEIPADSLLNSEIVWKTEDSLCNF